MRLDKDPPRLLDSSDEPLVRRTLGAARRELPDDERMQMLSVALLGKIGGGGGGGGGSPPQAGPGPGAAPGAASAGSSAVTAKATATALALALGAGAAWYAMRPPEHRAVPSPSEEAPPASAAIVAPPASGSAASDPSGPAPVPTFSFETLPTATANAPSASAPTAASAEAGGESEMDLLRRAQDALSASPASALSLCAEHERSFPRSSFAQEREVITITALLRLGRRTEAEARADRFAAAYPSSGHRRRIDSLLGR